MIVFNLLAIPVVIVIGIVYGALAFLFPSFMDGPYGDLVMSGVALVIGGVAELAGIKGRLFWLPIWFLALCVGIYQAWALWGWIGLAGGGVLLVVAIGLLLLGGRAAEAGMLKEAPQHLEAARAALFANDSEKFWEEMELAYLPPAFGKVSPELALHLGHCLDVMLAEASRLGLDDVQQRALLVARRIAEQQSTPRSGSPGFFSKETGLLAWPEKLARERGRAGLETWEREDLEKLERDGVTATGVRPG